MTPWLQTRLHDLMPGLDPALAPALAGHAQRRELGKDGPLLAAGDRWRHWWLVEHGVLRLYYLDSRGAESNKNFFLDGQPLWPLTERLRREPVNFFVAAVRPTVVHAIPMDSLESLVGATAAWAALRLQALQQLLDDKMWREQMFLQADAQQRYAQLRAARPQWCERIPLRHQALWLGMTDVSLSRVRAAWPTVRGPHRLNAG